MLAVAALALIACVDSAAGATTTVLTRYSDSSCVTTPQQVALSVASTAASCAVATVSGCASSGTSANSYYAKQTCAAVTAPDSAATTANAYFAASASPYVLMEVYATGAKCSSDALVSAVAFLADAKCLAVDSGDSSMKVSVAADGSAVLTTYSGASCNGTPTKTRTIASSDTAGKMCVNGALKFYTSAVATPTVSTGTASSAASVSFGSHAMPVAVAALLVAAAIV